MSLPPLTEDQTKRFTRCVLMVLQSEHQGEVATAARWLGRFLKERGIDVHDFAGTFARELQRQSAPGPTTGSGIKANWSENAFSAAGMRPARGFYHTEAPRTDWTETMRKVNRVFAIRLTLSEGDRDFLQAVRTKLLTKTALHPAEVQRLDAIYDRVMKEFRLTE